MKLSLHSHLSYPYLRELDLRGRHAEGGWELDEVLEDGGPLVPLRPVGAFPQVGGHVQEGVLHDAVLQVVTGGGGSLVFGDVRTGFGCL